MDLEYKYQQHVKVYLFTVVKNETDFVFLSVFSGKLNERLMCYSAALNKLASFVYFLSFFFRLMNNGTSKEHVNSLDD